MDKARNYLSLARKAGRIELGEEPVGAAARAKKAWLLVVASASDAGLSIERCFPSRGMGWHQAALPKYQEGFLREQVFKKVFKTVSEN